MFGLWSWRVSEGELLGDVEEKSPVWRGNLGIWGPTMKRRHWRLWAFDALLLLPVLITDVHGKIVVQIQVLWGRTRQERSSYGYENSLPVI